MSGQESHVSAESILQNNTFLVIISNYLDLKDASEAPWITVLLAGYANKKENAVEINSASFVWNHHQVKPALLKEIDIKVPKGSLTAIVGVVGSGKSSLLSSLIGDMIYVSDAEIEAFGGLDK